jgi:hypothetical protein
MPLGSITRRAVDGSPEPAEKPLSNPFVRPPRISRPDPLPLRFLIGVHELLLLPTMQSCFEQKCMPPPKSILVP